MECPRRWIVLSTIYIFSIQTANIYCQIDPLEEITTHYPNNDLKRDISKLLIPSSNTLTEKSYVANIQDDRSRTMNVISQSPSYYSQPTMSNNAPNLVFKPTLLPEPPCNGVPKIPLESYANMIQPVSAVWRISQPSNDVYSYPPANLQLTPPCPILPAINTHSGIVEFLSETNRGALFQEPITLQNGFEDGFPLNLQINVPSQNVPGPRITVVSAAPTPVTSANSNSFLPFSQFPPPLFPITKKKSRSCWRNLLPILLIALLNDQDDCGNGCCCSCNSDSPIPIPYPIPIPVNNPIINNDGSSFSSRKRGHRENEDDDYQDN